MGAASLYPVRPEVAANTLTDEATYKAMYQQSVVNPDGFWREQAKRLDWIKPFTTVKQTSFDDHHVDIKWFADGTLNVSYNCLDRHLAERGDQAAIIWEGDDPAESRTITYRELHEEVCKFANALRGQDVHRGDVVTIYMPMIPEAVVAMLACARIGAIHSVVFGGFSPEALAGRIIDCKSKVVITADEGIRAGKKIPLKANVDDALTNPETSSIQKVIVCKRTNGAIKWNQHRDIWYEDLMKVAGAVCAPKEMGAEEALFILYTSGSTGKPKGVQHTTGGYLLYAALTHERVFDYRPGEIYWCTADVGWVTGHTYIVYGPLANGATTLLFEGVPNYPDITRVAKIVDKHKVNILYTAPTAIRAMMASGTAACEGADGSSLRLLGSVGEPINPEAWDWYYKNVGQSRCPIVDTWWQTETGWPVTAPCTGLGQTEVQQVAFLSRMNRPVILFHRNSEETALRGVQNRLITVELVYSPRLSRAVSQALSSCRNLTTQADADGCNAIFGDQRFDWVVITTPSGPGYHWVEASVDLIANQILDDHCHALVLDGAGCGSDVRLGPTVVSRCIDELNRFKQSPEPDF